MTKIQNYVNGNVVLTIETENTGDDIQIWVSATYKGIPITVYGDFSRLCDVAAAIAWAKQENEFRAEIEKYNHVDYIDNAEDSELLSSVAWYDDYQEEPEDFTF